LRAINVQAEIADRINDVQNGYCRPASASDHRNPARGGRTTSSCEKPAGRCGNPKRGGREETMTRLLAGIAGVSLLVAASGLLNYHAGERHRTHTRDRHQGWLGARGHIILLQFLIEARATLSCIGEYWKSAWVRGAHLLTTI